MTVQRKISERSAADNQIITSSRSYKHCTLFPQKSAMELLSYSGVFFSQVPRWWLCLQMDRMVEARAYPCDKLQRMDRPGHDWIATDRDGKAQAHAATKASSFVPAALNSHLQLQFVTTTRQQTR
jgi:hypothetical protein